MAANGRSRTPWRTMCRAGTRSCRQGQIKVTAVWHRHGLHDEMHQERTQGRPRVRTRSIGRSLDGHVPVMGRSLDGHGTVAANVCQTLTHVNEFFRDSEVVGTSWKEAA